MLGTGSGEAPVRLLRRSSVETLGRVPSGDPAGQRNPERRERTGEERDPSRASLWTSSDHFCGYSLPPYHARTNDARTFLQLQTTSLL